MTHPEYLEYKQFEEEIRDTIESQYQMAVYQGDYEVAYNLLGKLMAYKLIEKDDERIEGNNKTFVKAGIDKNHRFSLDYRKTTDYIPSWLFGETEYSRVCKCMSAEHWGKRVEGNYEGDAIFPSRNYDIRITLSKTTKNVENAFVDIKSIMAENGNTKFSGGVLEELCKEGVYRVYNLVVEGSCIQSNKLIGCAVIKMGENGIEGTLVIKYSSLLNNWLPIKSTVEKISSTIKSMVGGSGTFKVAINWDKAIDSQQGKFSQSNAMSISKEKHANKQ